MVSITSLFVPVVLSAVIVFVASSIIHMVLPYHRTDFRKVPSEDGVMEALRDFDIPPGDYVLPFAGSTKELGDEAFIEKSTKGPVAFITVVPSGPPTMGVSLAQWFGYCLVVGTFAGYVTGRSLGPGAGYEEVFRLVSTTAFMGYGLALMQSSIWYKLGWSVTAKSMFDGVVYALLTAGVFGWLWP